MLFIAGDHGAGRLLNMEILPAASRAFGAALRMIPGTETAVQPAQGELRVFPFIFFHFVPPKKHLNPIIHSFPTVEKNRFIPGIK